MLTFACKKIRHEELVRCSFNINKTEYNVLMFLLKNRGFHSVREIAKKMGFERTTVQKAIKKLSERGLARRVQNNLPKGGYSFLYQANKKDEIKKEMKEIVQRWVKIVEREIERI